MKWSKLARGTVGAGQGLRIRLARRGDEAFLERMSRDAGVGQAASRVGLAYYQSGFRAALNEPNVGFCKAVQTACNRTGERDLSQGIAATFDLVATVDGKPVGSLHMGPPGAVVGWLLADEKIHVHQLVVLVLSVSKLIGVGVAPEHRGKGYGRALVAFARRAADRNGSLVMFGECPDVAASAALYESHGFTVIPSGARLNLWPVAGSHLGDRKMGDPALGPLVQTEPGYRLFAVLEAAQNQTMAALADLNPSLPRMVHQ